MKTSIFYFWAHDNVITLVYRYRIHVSLTVLKFETADGADQALD